MATKPGTAAPPETPKKGKKVLFILVGAVLVLALVAAGALVMLKKSHNEESADEGDEAVAEQEAHPKKKAKADPGHPPTFVPLEAFTVNLQPGDDGAEQYLQVVVNFRAQDAHVGEEIKSYTPEIRHRILMLLSAKKAADLTAVAGREALAGEICAEANSTLGYEPKAKRGTKTEEAPGCANGPVQAVLFTSFMIQ